MPTGLPPGDDSISQSSLGTEPVVSVDEDTVPDLKPDDLRRHRFDWFGLPPLVVGLIGLAILAGLGCLAAAIWLPN